MKCQEVECVCPKCSNVRTLAFNATRFKNISQNEEGKYFKICKSCSIIEIKERPEYFQIVLKQKGKCKRLTQLNIGDVFGKLTIINDIPRRKVWISPKGNRTVRAEWMCQCECGNILFKTNSNLKDSKKVKMCTSCAYKNRPQSTRRYSPEERLYRLMIVDRCAKSDRIDNFITIDEFLIVAKQNCHYCDAEPRLRKYTKNKIVEDTQILLNGIDRIDSSKHYSVDNIVPCCTICNRIKNDLELNKFKEHIIKIYNKFKENEK